MLTVCQNKISELRTIVTVKSPDIVCITEVVPRNTTTSVQESEIQLQGYDMFSNLSDAKRGVIIYVKSELKVKARQSCVTDTCAAVESCWTLKLKL